MGRKIFKCIFVIHILFFIVISFILKPIKVQGNSMYPTLKDGDWVLINKLSYLVSDTKTGDIIVFKLPKDDRGYMIKRIIGLEEETIEIVSGSTYINNNKLSETYIKDFYTDSFYRRIIPENHIFVLGDNRKLSVDSRYEDIGFVEKKCIVGKIIFKW